MEKKGLEIKKACKTCRLRAQANVCLRNEFKENPRGFCVCVCAVFFALHSNIFCAIFSFLINDM